MLQQARVQDRAESRYNSCITGCRYAGRTVKVLGRLTSVALTTSGVGAPAGLITFVVTQATSRTVVLVSKIFRKKVKVPNGRW